MWRLSVKRAILSLALCLILGFSYWLCRFALFGIVHGMKDWPDLLAAFGVIVLLISLIKRADCLAFSASLGYIVGFVIGFLFQTDGVDPGGGTTNNLWKIWTVAYFTCIIFGIALDLRRTFKKDKKSRD